MLQLLRNFLADRSGNIALMSGAAALGLLVLSGAGIDLTLYERQRIQLQTALDAGLVAAAALKQPFEAERTLQSYLTAAGHANATLSVEEKRSSLSRKVVATAQQEHQTYFLRIVGVDTLGVAASGSAEESYRSIEVSLVLDLSGSMRGSRITAMRPAAKLFIDQLLTADTKQHTSVSIIPYAGQVSVGEQAFKKFGGGPLHDKSWCFGNKESTFTSVIPNFATAEHVPQFSTWLKGTNTGFDAWNCPTQETSISYISNDAAALKSEIDGYHMFDGTATQIAMKWGLYLLDPAIRPKLDSAGLGSSFPARPAAFSDTSTFKVIVLMTDGEVVAQFRPKSGLPVNEQPTAANTNNQVLSQATAINMMSAACDAAKGRGVTVYAIGFETNSASPTFLEKLRSCASSPDKFYEAKTSDIGKIFQDVARSISPLRLTQ